MPHFAGNCSSWRDLHDQRLPQALSKNVNLKEESPMQHSPGAEHLGIQLHDHDSLSTQSSSQSRYGVTAMVKAKSLDQYVSSESAQDVHIQGQATSGFSTSNAEFPANKIEAHIPYATSEPYFNWLFATYGPQAFPQMAGTASARVPLPLDLAEDGPIFVNAKQYHGILRRRQIRAKLEAENKLVKNRRPYLHESRHHHALKRVRGSGGRFVSAKRAQESDPTSSTNSRSDSGSLQLHYSSNISHVEANQFEAIKNIGLTSNCLEKAEIVSQNRYPVVRFSRSSPDVAPLVQDRDRKTCNGTWYCDPAVR